MRRYIPFAIIAGVLLIATGSALMLLRWKQPPSSPTIPIVPLAQDTPSTPSTPSMLPDTTATPGMPDTPAAPAKPDPELPHIRGGANAPVTIEEFGDFQCLPCAELFPVLAKVEEHYGERLRVIFRHKPLRKHVHAVIAACAAEAAGLQGRFWEMHDLLYQNMPRWTKGIDTVGPDASPSRRLQSNILAMDLEVRDVFLTYAERLKLDVERFKQDIDSAEVKARVESDRARGDALGIDRTPTLYVNGRLLNLTRRNADEFHAAIDAELNAKGKPEAASSAPTATPGQPR